MKTIYRFFLVLTVVLAGGLLTSCNNDDLSTNQFKNGIALNAYGPNPCTRGGVLRFVGSNLDRIVSVNIPGVDPITSFEVKRSGIPSEIWVTVPKDGPQPGFITLTANDSTVITTQQEVYYTENVEFTSFSPTTAQPGDELTITGEYLNLIKMVEFSDGIRVSKDNFISQDRYSIKLHIPENAISGRINLYTADLIADPTNDDYEVFQSEKELIIGTD